MNYKDTGTVICRTVQLYALLTLVMFHKQVFTFTGCQISSLTEEYVNQCPRDAESWKLAAKQKECESIKQECTKPVGFDYQRYVFQYHCLMNSWGNATIEVCALNRTIFGYCAEYDADGALVQDNYDIDCKQRDPPCPALYNSAEAYQFQYCYDLVYKKRSYTIGAGDKGSTSFSKRYTGSYLLILQSVVLAFHGPIGQ